MTKRWLKFQIAIITCVSLATVSMSVALIMTKSLFAALAFICFAFNLYVEINKYRYWRLNS